jgi:hypothetical protein
MFVQEVESMARDFLSDNTVQINVGSFGLHAVKTVTQKLEGEKSTVEIIVLMCWIEWRSLA